jgi:23S rRNA U2552 (ribose-2'-O)-methylase RlmE/FtsJ
MAIRIAVDVSQYVDEAELAGSLERVRAITNEARGAFDVRDTRLFFKVKSKWTHSKMLAGRFPQAPSNNAWFKMYEMANTFKLGRHLGLAGVRHFDNGALPGAFILACQEYFKDMCAYSWEASSYLGEGALTDDYNLMRDHPNQWKMGAGRGDMRCLADVLEVAKGATECNLYTSDVGMDIDEDWNNQEAIHAPAHAGQTLLGLIVLEKGGVFIVKQYSMFEAFTQSVVSALAGLFDEFYVCKPLTSKQSNLETYLVGVGYAGREAAVRLIAELQLRLSNWTLAAIPDIRPLRCVLDIQLRLAAALTRRIGEIVKHFKEVKRNPRALKKQIRQVCDQVAAWPGGC